MSEASLRLVEIGIAGLALAVASHTLGIFRIELVGVAFFLATLAGQSVAALLEQCVAAAHRPETADRPA